MRVRVILSAVLVLLLLIAGGIAAPAVAQPTVPTPPPQRDYPPPPPQRDYPPPPPQRDYPPPPPRGPRKPPGQLPGYGDHGLFLNNTNGDVTGVQAYFSVYNTNFLLSAQSPDRDQSYYTPTLMPPNNSCLEVTETHWRYAGQSVMGHGLGFWDWCGLGAGGDGTQGWQAFLYIDSAFITAYAPLVDMGGSHGTDRVMKVQVTKIGNCSYGYIYRWSSGVWENKAVSCGTNPYNQVLGWTMFEIWGATQPPGSMCFGPLGPYNKNSTDLIKFKHPDTGYILITAADHGADIVPYYPDCWTTPIGGRFYTYTQLSDYSWIVHWN